jgi:hypothetical protein
MDELIDSIKRILTLMEVEKSTEVNEDDESASTETTTDTTSSSYPTVKKHSDTYQTKRGKANVLNKKDEKWATGRSYGKTYMNDPNYKWESGRTMGSTGP